MRAQDHTRRMLGWWRGMGVDRVDLAVKRRGRLVEGLAAVELMGSQAAGALVGQILAPDRQLRDRRKRR